jgi:hypothetical protein
MLDTETIGLEEPLVYDVGFAVIDREGNVYESYSYVVQEVFYGMPEKMKSAYYACKIPEYYSDIERGTRKVGRFFFIQGVINQLLIKYQIKAVIAHNMRFDYNALNYTARYISGGIRKYFFPYGTDIWCTLAMARSIMYQKPVYKQWCIEHEFIQQKNKQPRMTAEILYRFISGIEDFQERHTGIEDVMIEAQIFAYLVRQHKKMKRHYWNEEKRG